MSRSLDNLAGIHADSAIRHPHSLLLVVADPHNGPLLPSLVKPLRHTLLDSLCRGRIQCRGRFVQQQHVRLELHRAAGP